MPSAILLLLFTSIVHYATASIDDTCLITMVPLKTGGDAGWIQESWTEASQEPVLTVQQRQVWKRRQDFGAWFTVEHAVGVDLSAASRKMTKDVEGSDSAWNTPGRIVNTVYF